MISHFFFADDSLIFFWATNKDCTKLKSCFLKYERAFGQLINYDKSTITFSSHTPSHSWEFIRITMNMSVCQGHDIYLGLPTFSLRGKKTQFDYLRDRVAKKVENWTSRHFPEGAREVLIKAVFVGRQFHSMRCPVSEFQNRFVEILNGFAITSGGGRNLMGTRFSGARGMSYASQRIRVVLAFFLTPLSLVARLFKARYFRDGDVGNNPSYVWITLLE